jgi:2-keto-4-pentenoate hydratase/2-oxohepta-3-ene-1,7-dioic acid hydratase in catechol pathway
MTGTPAGVGAFQKPRTWLKIQDVIEIEVTKVGIFKE